MPSLEIICIGQAEPCSFSDLSFAVESETELVSHRYPSLFQVDFNRLHGCIYHLHAHKHITVYALLKRDWYTEEGGLTVAEESLEFRAKFSRDLQLVIDRLLANSPVGQILFTSDYQFGPRRAHRYGRISFEAFWNLHQAGKIRLNTSYLITAGYQQMAADGAREAEALEWAEALVGDGGDGAR